MRGRLLLVVLGLILTGVWAVGQVLHAPVELSEGVTLDIISGQSMTQMADSLDNRGALHSRYLFLLWARVTDRDRKIIPGRYIFSGPTSMTDILDSISRGRGRETVTVTIPEGWTTDQIVARLAQAFDIPAETFTRILGDSSRLERWGAPVDNVEGYLLPDTYTFFWEADAGQILDRMGNASRCLFDRSVRKRMDSLGMTRHEVLTLASMVEAETGHKDERPRIAAVFHNRLRRGMLLQCDPTVIYAMGGLKPGRQLWSNDLKIDSPYNTYKYPGLPPGPICHPGREAIMAVLYPDSTNELYFVADGTGGHIFSESLREHNRARAQVKRKQRGG